MERERLSELLLDPSRTATGDMASLRAMTERFPWFSGAQLLLAVSQHGSGEVLSNEARSAPAAFLPSRAVLYDLLKEEEPDAPLKPAIPLPSEHAAVHQAEPAVIPPSPPVEIEEAVPVQPVPPESPGTIGQTTASTDEPSTVRGGSDPEPVEENSLESPSLSAPEPLGQPGAEILEKQFQEAIMASGYRLGEISSGPPPQENALVIPQKPREAPVIKPVHAAPPPEPQQERIIPAAGKLKFTAWLEMQEGPVTAPEPAPSTETQTKTEESPAPAQTQVKARPGSSAAEIMEQFIRRGEVEPKAKASFFNPQQAAKKSLEDHGLVSETLARILEKQGNYSKAREVYDRLALKHPEKSVYFAALSKALEGRSNK